MRSSQQLREYKAKRNFSRTREPAGRARLLAQREAPAFVVQKHDASRLHYDFRLEMDGVLKSWAVPKGFPTRRGERRLAVQVEDHPVEYGGFEGTIPEGNYGAGTVMVWDRGTYRVGGNDPAGALASGKLHLSLQGKKLKGEWTLVRMRPRDKEAKPQWLLLKSGTDVPSFSPAAENRSALSARNLKEISGASKKNEWQSDRMGRGSVASPASRSKASARSERTRNGAKDPRSKRANETGTKAHGIGVSARTGLSLMSLPRMKPAFVEPMKALVREHLPEGDGWCYEIKFDGVRALAVKDGKRVTLWSRAGNMLGNNYPEVLEALSSLRAGQAVLDGEIVALDSLGRSDFQLLQSYLTHQEPKPPLFYYVFDLLNLDARNLMHLPLSTRKDLAESLVKEVSQTIRFSPGIQAEREKLIREMKARGLEGILAKRVDSKYEPGRRSGAWVKYKWTHQQEFVIGGYTQPKGGRTHFGALLVGYYQGSNLLFAGKVGTGFDQTRLARLFRTFQGLRRAECPFANLPEKLPGAGGGITASQMRRCTWLKPNLVCEVRFAEWTRDHHLRQPAFLGLRDDKDAGEVVREAAATRSS